MIMMEQHYENQFAYFRIHNEIVFLEIKDDVVLDLDAAEAITFDRLQFQNDKSYRLLIDINGFVDSDKSGRDYLAQFGCGLTKKISLVAAPYTHELLAKFYLRFSKPTVETKVFCNTVQALDFLNNP